MHPMIKLTADWPKPSIHFLEVAASIAQGIIEIDLYVKPTDGHQHLFLSSCHLCYCKKGIPYNQALKLNRICSSNEFFDKRWNDLKKYLLGRDYCEKIVCEEIHF